VDLTRGISQTAGRTLDTQRCDDNLVQRPDVGLHSNVDHASAIDRNLLCGIAYEREYQDGICGAYIQRVTTVDVSRCTGSGSFNENVKAGEGAVVFIAHGSADHKLVLVHVGRYFRR